MESLMSPTALALDNDVSESPQRRVPKWEPPLDAAELATVLDKIRTWSPFVLDAVFDDLDRVLGELAPAAAELDELSDRLRGALTQLCGIAVADRNFLPDSDLLQLVERGRTLADEEAPGDYRHALGLTRRLAWTTSELIERLMAAQHIGDSE
jgi:Family of unknown function (DUF6415)